jgi:FkbM family methyltransferase
MDIGAHSGLWTRDVLAIDPTAQVIVCEPQPELREQIQRRFAADPRMTIEDRAITDHAGTAELHFTDASVNASLHEPRPGMNALYRRGWGVQRTQLVETTTVDELSAGRDVALLKIDVQGAEREVLVGASSTLPRTSAVMLEVVFISHYKDDATFPGLHEQMTAAGFLLTGISAAAHSPAGAMLCSDAAYVNARYLDAHFSR